MEQDKKKAELQELKEFERETRDANNWQEKMPESVDLENEKIESSQEIFSQLDMQKKKKKNDVIVELTLFFVLGLLLGITIKTEAAKRLTIGFDDYKIEKSRQGFDVSQMERELLRKAEQQKEAQQAAQQVPQEQASQQVQPQ